MRRLKGKKTQQENVNAGVEPTYRWWGSCKLEGSKKSSVGKMPVVQTLSIEEKKG